MKLTAPSLPLPAVPNGIPASRMLYTLDYAEFHCAAQTALLRMAVSIAAGLNHASTYQRTWMKRLEEETIGACGELAVAKAFNRFLVPSVNTFHRVPDCIRDVEVRSTSIPDGRLIIRDNDAQDRRYILCTVTLPNVILCGWLFGHEARQDVFLDNPNNVRKAWFVPQTKLNPMFRMPELY